MRTVDASAEGLARIWSDVAELGLEREVAEIEAQGYTVIPPERLSPAGFGDRLANAVSEVAERRDENGLGATYDNRVLHYMLCEGRVFEEALLHRVPLTLITYLLGESCVLSSMVAMLKGPGDVFLPLHSDTGPGVPAPFPRYAQVANATWVLSDYTVANGALCFVPGSHHLCRHPVGEPTDPRANPAVVPIEARTGSLIVWHGNLWHGAFPRTEPGQRMNLVMFFARTYLRPQEVYAGKVSDEILARNPARLATLLGFDHPFPADMKRGVDPRRVAALGTASANIHG